MFLYQFHPGDRPELATDPAAWTADDELVFEEHFAYLEAGAEEGKVVMAGRSQDGVGPAIVIVDLADETAARRFMEADPFIKGGLFTSTLHPYRIALQRAPSRSGAVAPSVKEQSGDPAP